MSNKQRKLTCIVCPKGCDLVVEFDSEGSIINIDGYTCKRGKDYALAECTSPVRTVTSTVRCKDGEVVSVKTTAPIPKAMVFEVMKAINSVNAECDLKIGDVIISDVLGTGADVVATSNKNK